MTVKRTTLALLLPGILLFSACAEEKLTLNSAAAKALIGFSQRMTESLNKAEQSLRNAGNGKDAAAFIATLPGLFGTLRKEAGNLQKQYKDQDFSHFKTAAGQRQISADRTAFTKAAASFIAMIQGEDAAKVKAAADAFAAGAEKGDRDKLLTAFQAASDKYKTSADKKISGAAVGALNAADRLVETALLMDVMTATGNLQVAMKKLDTTYKSLEKKYKDDADFKAAVTKMKDEFKKQK